MNANEANYSPISIISVYEMEITYVLVLLVQQACRKESAYNAQMPLIMYEMKYNIIIGWCK